MPIFLALALFCVPGAAIAVKLGQRFEQTIGVAFLVVVALGYGFSLFGAIRFAVFAVYALWAAAAAYLAWAAIKKRVDYTKLLTPGLAAFVLLALLVWWINRGRMFTSWDEYSHWGRAIKNMFYLDDLYTVPASNDSFKDYPPATAVLQYLFLKVGRMGFREDAVSFITALFSCSMLVYPLTCFGWKKLPGAALCGALLLFAPALLFGDFYTLIAVDAIMGVLLMFALAVHFFAPHPTAKTLVASSLALFVLSATKSAGFGLAIMAAVAIAVDCLVNHRAYLGKRFGGPKMLAAVVAPFVASLAAKLSWSAYLAINNVVGKWDNSESMLSGIIQMIQGAAPAYRYEVWAKYWGDFFTSRNYGTLIKLSPAMWFLLLGLLFLVVWFFAGKGNRRKWNTAGITVAAIDILFFVSLCFTYLFVFDEVEAVVLASVSRYQNTVLLFSLLFLLGAAAQVLQPLALKKQLIGFACALLLCLEAGNPVYLVRTIVQAPTRAAQTQHDRYLVGYMAERIEATGSRRVYMVSQNDGGFASLLLDYELAPYSIPEYPSSLQTNAYDYGDLTSAQMQPEEWAALLYEECDFVYLYNIDGFFTVHYRELFTQEDDIVNDSMLRVVKGEPGEVTLVSAD